MSNFSKFKKVDSFLPFFFAILLLGVSVARLARSALIQNFLNVQVAKRLLPIGSKFPDSIWFYLLSDSVNLEDFSTGNGDTTSIEAILKIATKIDPENSQWQVIRARTDLANGDITPALVNLENAQVYDNDRSGVNHLISGILYKVLAKKDRAIQIWRASPETLKFFLMAGGYELYVENRIEDAHSIYNLANETFPNQCEVKYRLTVINQRLGDSSGSLDVLKNFDEFACPVSILGEIYYLQGRLLWSQGDIDSAIERLRLSVSLDRKDVKRLMMLGDLLVAKDGTYWQEARDLFVEAVGVSPENMVPFLRLCDLEKQQKHYQGAEDWCAQAMEKFPMEYDPYYYMGLIYLDKKDYRQAIDWLSQANLRDANQSKVWIRLGDAYYGDGDESRALFAYQNGQRFDPHNAYVQRRILELTSEKKKSPENP